MKTMVHPSKTYSSSLNGLFIILVLLILSSCSSTRQTNAIKIAPINFKQAEKTLIESASIQTPLRVLKMTNKADSIFLRKKCNDVVLNTPDPLLDIFTTRLLNTVKDSMSLGVGIAAPQVGIAKNIVLIQRFDKPDFPFETYYNPKILKYTEKKQECKEGCLSIPDRSEMLNCRAYAILLEYYKRDNTKQIEMIEGFTAVIFQHEIDHLNGIVYLDHLEKESDK